MNNPFPKKVISLKEVSMDEVMHKIIKPGEDMTNIEINKGYVELSSPEEMIKKEVTIDDIKKTYHSFKSEDTKASSPLTDAYSLKGMDTINELVANAFLEIDEL